jgi:hypothetical protein
MFSPVQEGGLPLKEVTAPGTQTVRPGGAGEAFAWRRSLTGHHLLDCVAGQSTVAAHGLATERRRHCWSTHGSS